MSTAMEKAYRAARQAQERTYIGLVTVKEYRAVTDPETHITRNEWVIVLENQPCKLSFETVKAAVQTETAAMISQAAKLFLSPDVTISAGSKLTVTQNGKTTAYSSSGVPAVYPTHQEIILELEESTA